MPWDEGLVDRSLHASDPSEGRVLSMSPPCARRSIWRSERTPPSSSSARRGRSRKRQSDDFYEVIGVSVHPTRVQCAPLEMAGAVGVEQLKKLDRILSIRRDNAALFRSLSKETIIIQLIVCSVSSVAARRSV